MTALFRVFCLRRTNFSNVENNGLIACSENMPANMADMTYMTLVVAGAVTSRRCARSDEVGAMRSRHLCLSYEEVDPWGD